MNFKRSLAIAALIIVLLSPTGRLLRTQQPFQCFQTTYDENVFLQAIHNWKEGKGFRQNEDLLPFDAKITIGPYIAWGTVKIQNVTRFDLPQSARLFTYIHFILLLLLVGSIARRTSGRASDGLVAVSFLGWAVTQIPSASYMTYGVLGEIPALLVFLFAASRLERAKVAGVTGAAFLGVLSATTKPTLLFGLASLPLAYRKKFVSLLAWITLFSLGWLYYVARTRNQTLWVYLQEMYAVSKSISTHGGSGGLFSLYGTDGSPWANLKFYTVCITIYCAFFSHKSRIPARAMAVFFLIGLSYYLLLGIKPLDKHWAVFMLAGSISVSLWVGRFFGRILAFLIQDRSLGVASVAIMATWLLNVIPIQKRHFQFSGDKECAVKEQRAIGKMLKEGIALSPNTPVLSVMEGGAAKFVYELEKNPVESRELPNPLPSSPYYLYGDHGTLKTPPSSCKEVFKGSMYGLWSC